VLEARQRFHQAGQDQGINRRIRQVRVHALNLARVRLVVRCRRIFRLRVPSLKQVKAQRTDKKSVVTLVLRDIARSCAASIASAFDRF